MHLLTGLHSALLDRRTARAARHWLAEMGSEDTSVANLMGRSIKCSMSASKLATIAGQGARNLKRENLLVKHYKKVNAVATKLYPVSLNSVNMRVDLLAPAAITS